MDTSFKFDKIKKVSLNLLQLYLNSSNILLKIQTAKIRDIKKKHNINHIQESTLIDNTAIRFLIRLNPVQVICGCGNGQLKVWEITTGKCISTINQNQTGRIECVEKLTSNSIAFGTLSGLVQIWGLSTLEKLINLKVRSDDSGSALCISKLDFTLLACGYEDKTIKLWDYVNGTLLSALKGHSCPVKCLIRISRYKIASAGDDKSIKIWEGVDNSTKKEYEEYTIIPRTLKSDDNSSNYINCLVRINLNTIASGNWNKVT